MFFQDPIAPSITEAPKSQTNLTIGHELTMKCVAHGIPHPDIVWTKDNILTTLPVNTTKYQGNATSLVTVAAVDIAQFGVYQCQAKNSEGEAQSSPANITGKHCYSPGSVFVDLSTLWYPLPLRKAQNSKRIISSPSLF